MGRLWKDAADVGACFFPEVWPTFKPRFALWNASSSFEAVVQHHAAQLLQSGVCAGGRAKHCRARSAAAAAAPRRPSFCSCSPVPVAGNARLFAAVGLQGAVQGVRASHPRVPVVTSQAVDVVFSGVTAEGVPGRLRTPHCVDAADAGWCWCCSRCRSESRLRGADWNFRTPVNS